MRSNRRALLLVAAASALSAIPAVAQGASSGLVEIDPCTGKPYTARADSARAAGGAAGTHSAHHPHAATSSPGGAPAAGHAHPGGTTAAGTPVAAHQPNPGTASSMGTPVARDQPNPGTASSMGVPVAGDQPNPGAASSIGAPAAGTSLSSGAASSISAPVAGSQPNPSAASSMGAPVAGNQPNPGAASSVGTPVAGNQPNPGMTSSVARDNPPGALFSPTGAAVPDTGNADREAAARNRSRLRLGTGAVRGQVRLGPAASVSVPTAFGVDAGELFVGVAYQGRTRFTKDDDAAAVAGLGIGTRRVLAVELALTSYSTVRGAPLETGGVSVKLHRAVGENTSVAVGYENAILWGGSDDDGSLYAAATRLVALRPDPSRPFGLGVFTLGVGNGRFRFEDDYLDDKETVNVFGAVGLRVTEPLSLVGDWTGQDLNLAASVTPIRRVPLVVTAGVADVTGLAGDGARFILSVGYGLSIRQPFTRSVQ